MPNRTAADQAGERFHDLADRHVLAVAVQQVEIDRGQAERIQAAPQFFFQKSA